MHVNKIILLFFFVVEAALGARVFVVDEVGPPLSLGSPLGSSLRLEGAGTFGFGAPRFFFVVLASVEGGGASGNSESSTTVPLVPEAVFLVAERVVVRGWALGFFGAAGARETLRSPGFSSSRLEPFFLGAMSIGRVNDGKLAKNTSWWSAGKTNTGPNKT